MNFIKVNDKDNVITLINNHKKGEIIDNIVLLNNIDKGHKVALDDIKKGEHIIKYGEPIGIASINIKKGEHIHIHNLEGIRGRGDKK